MVIPMENKILAELKMRKSKIVNYLDNNGLDGFFVFDPFNIFYTCDFFHVPTERPIICFFHVSGKVDLFVPLMEKEEANHLQIVDNISVYFEYPGKQNIYSWVIKELKAVYKKVDNVAIDSVGYRLYSKLVEEFADVEVSDLLYDMRLCKTELEIEFLKKAAGYSDFIVDYGFKILEPGKTELDLLAEMKSATIEKMIIDMGEIIYVPGGPAGGLVPSGNRTALPHALPSAKKIEKGDTMILSCGANVHGYKVECERTCFVGEPEQKKVEVFEIMKKAQEMGISLMKPGISCSEIDNKVLDFIREEGYGDYIRHRTGHGKGLQKHEKPWVEIGDNTVLKPGMVLSSEPGIYIEGFSGFRHSDTIVVTEGDPLVLTGYSKDLENLVVDL